MRMSRTLVLGATLAALGTGLLPAAAQAAPDTGRTTSASATPAAPTGAQADGKLHLFRDTHFRNFCAAYVGNSTNWGACRNQISSLKNLGYPGALDDVWLYYGPNYSGARRGVYNGGEIPDLTPYPFDAGTGTGAGQSINDNVASHKWTNL
ncbi:hypothetical protein [Streptomyces sp. NPDC017940]|uniref:hypothetical protein n=1 Tax=Streptomyces sp. NPDC017940 TaxID=3365017 RepID=UPI003787A232